MADETRHYDHSSLRAVSDVGVTLSDQQRAVLEKLYSEVCNTWRTLVDVRFKLLGLVPFVSVAILLVVLPGSQSSDHLVPWASRVVSAVGLLVTIGLLIYEVRNSELYDDLISRGRRIEAELGIDTGVFRGRPKPGWPLINHTTAIVLVYGAALLGWLAALICAA